MPQAGDFLRYLWARTGSRSWSPGRVPRVDDEVLDRVRSWTAAQPLPKLTICIPTKDRLDLLVPCLLSLAETCAERPVEVVIGDTGSTAATRTVCSRMGLPIVPVPGPFNFSSACNTMARAARGEMLLFLNSDTQAVSDWADCALTLPTDTVTGAALVYPGTQRLQHAGVEAVRARRRPQRNTYRPRRRTGGSDLAIQNVGIGRPLQSVTVRSAPVMAVTAALIITTRVQFEALGGFDESYGVDLQDIDYCLRARSSGLEVVCRRDIVFSHRHAGSRGRYAFPHADWRLLLERWRAELEQWSEVPAVL